MVPYDVPLIDSDFITRALRLQLAREEGVAANGGRAKGRLGIDRLRLTAEFPPRFQEAFLGASHPRR